MFLIQGQAWIGLKQWELNIAVLNDVPTLSLRRLQFCVIFGDQQIACPDAIGQVKQFRWTALKVIISRFRNLEEIAIVTRGADEWVGDHIWQEIETSLRSLKKVNGRRLVIRRYFCF